MIEVIAILLFAFLLIGLEAIVPGGVLGILGFCCIVFSAYQAHLAFGGWFAPMLTFILGSVAAVMIVFVELKWLSKSKLGKSMFLSSATGGTSNESFSTEEVMGKKGEALTDHRPEGSVSIDGKTYDAVCVDGYLPKGSKVRVTGLDDFRIRIARL